MEHPHSVHSGHTSFKKKARNGANGGNVEAWIAVRVTFLPNKLPPRKPLLISQPESQTQLLDNDCVL